MARIGLHHWRITAGSADEVRSTLRVAEAWEHVRKQEVAEPLEFFDGVLGIPWRLTH